MIRRLAVITVILTVAAAGLGGLVAPLDDTLAELRMRLSPRPATGAVAVIDIDSRSIDRIGTWPWPRSIYAELLDRLVGLGAAEIALDIDFSSPSTETDDAALEAALGRAGGAVSLAAFAQTPSATAPTIAHNHPIDRFAQVSWPALVNVVPDADGAVRELPAVGVMDGEPVPSLAALIAGGEAGGAFLVDFGIDPASIDRMSLVDVLDGSVARERIAGKKVVVGAQAIELRDYFQVPVHGRVSGAMLQALGAESILQGRTLSATSPLVSFVGLAVIALIAGLAILRRTGWVAAVGAAIAAAIAIEVAALILQTIEPVILRTGAWQIALAGLALAALLGEIDIRRILLAISRNQTRNAEAVLDRVIDDNFAGIVIAGADGRILTASRRAGEMLATDSLVGGTIAERLPAPIAAAAERALAGTTGDGALSEMRLSRPDGSVCIFEYTATRSRLSGGIAEDGRRLDDYAVVCITFCDVTERRLAEEKVAYLARFDTLTGLPNRNQIVEMLESTTADEAVAVVAFDVERFDLVVDTLGYDFGDGLLKAVAERAKQLVGSSDRVGRIGGCEFVALFSGSDVRDRAVGFAREMLARVGEPYILGGHRVTAGITAGIAMASDGGPSASLAHAEMALHRAKAEGGNGLAFFDHGSAAAIARRRELEIDLWEAFRRDQFEVWYQPQVELRTGELVGVEALVRWRHPERGFIPPSEFVPVAEAVGMIGPLGKWILERACCDVAGLPGGLKVAVNVSPLQFAHGNLSETVSEALRRSGLPAKRLEIEITEAMFVGESVSTRSTLAGIALSGVRFAIDDFGTGYSSLGYLRRFPIHKIKLDRSFVSGLPHDPQAVAIVQAVAAMSHNLDIRLNAEGIETAEQVEFLRLLGFDEAQGYHFGKPQPLAGIAAMMTGSEHAVRLIA